MFEKFGRNLPQSLIDIVTGIEESDIHSMRKIQDLKDKQAAEKEADWWGEKEKGSKEKQKPTTRTVAGHSYGGSKQKPEKELDEEQLGEREMTAAETKKKEEIVRSMKKGLPGFNNRYGDRAKEVMYATATKKAMGEDRINDSAELMKNRQQQYNRMEEVELDEDQLNELSPQTLGSYVKKASQDINDKSTKAGDALVKSHGNYALNKKLSVTRYDASKADQAKRVKGIATAVGKLTKETMMGTAGATSEETEIEESSAHKFLATKLKQISMRSHGMAPELSVTGQDIKDRLKDAKSLSKAELVKQKETDVTNEEVEIDEASRAKLSNYISAAKSDEKKDRSAGIKLAQKKKWGDEKYGTVSAKVPANEESDTPFEGPYKQEKGTVTDKSGAKHTPMSSARDLARKALTKLKSKKVELDEDQLEEVKMSDSDVKFNDAMNAAHAASQKISVAKKKSKWSDSDVKFNDAMNAAHAKSKTNEEVELDEGMSDAAHELVVHGDNDSHLFHSSREPIIANLKQKVAKGTYDHEKAKKLWNYHADRTAQSYAKEHGDGKTPWHKQFTTADRKQAASHFADQARDEHLNEEVEQIDELSKDTLASYEKKSRVAAHKHALASELKGLAADPAGSYAHKMMADKRHAGWKVAVKKLNTEESDLEEGSSSYPTDKNWDKSGRQMDPLNRGIGPSRTRANPKSTTRDIDAANFQTKRAIKGRLADPFSKKAVKLPEEVEQIIETEVLNRYIKSLGYDPIHLDRNKKVMFAKTNAFKSFASRQEGKTPDQEDDIHMSPGATARG